MVGVVLTGETTGVVGSVGSMPTEGIVSIGSPPMVGVVGMTSIGSTPILGSVTLRSSANDFAGFARPVA
jgi:hypothetical protein